MQTIAEFKKNLSESGSVQWLPQTSLETLWHFEMKADRAAVWKHISDTSRFNRELGLAPRTEKEIDGRLEVSTSLLGFPQEWIEEPWTWIAEQSICSVRRYKKGIAHSVQAVFTISEASDPSKRIVSIYFGWHARNLFWKLLLRLSEKSLKNKFAAAFLKIDSLVKKQASPIDASLLWKAGKSLSAEQMEYLQAKRELLRAQPANQACLDSLFQFIQDADDFDIDPIRLLPLARQWQHNLDELLVAALHATRAGVLKLSWNLLCPHCKGPRLSAASLGEVPEKSECKVCDITFSTDTADAVEIVFQVHPAVREIPDFVYCAAEPAKKSHIKVQQSLAPGETKKFFVTLKEDSYRARFQGEKNYLEIDVRAEHKNSYLLLENSLPTTRIQVSNHFQVELKKNLEQGSYFVIEELQQKDQALRPGQVLSVPEFRDIFSEEHLRSNVKLYLGEQSILFTDIVGSTEFYKRVGDAKAFAEVQAHFTDVVQTIKQHRGVLVKTIGDAAMGAFPKIENALAAAVAIQEKFPPHRSDLSIRLRISVHSGPVIGAKLDTGIDYFGGTVNLVAKIQSCAGAHEIALSPKAYESWRTQYKDIFPIEIRLNNRDADREEEVFVAKLS